MTQATECRCVEIPDAKYDPKEFKSATLVENLMGRKPELRLTYIQENAKFVRDLDV
jgi:topoisomerase-4 subunit B